MPVTSVIASRRTPSHGFSDLGPQTATRGAPARTKDAVHLCDGAARFEREHHPFATEDDLERFVGFADVLQIEHLGAHIVERARACSALRDLDHLGNHVGEHDFAAGTDTLRSRQTRSARTTCELEDPITGLQTDGVEHVFRDGTAALVDVLRVCTPLRGDVRPHRADRLSLLVLFAGHGLLRFSTELTTRNEY